MSGPWEKYSAPDAAADEGPWAKYAPAAESATAAEPARAPMLGLQAGWGETALHLGSGAVAGVAAGYAGMAQGIANQFGTPGMSAADRVHQVQDKFTYEPRSLEGKIITAPI